MLPTTRQRMILNQLRPGPLHLPPGVQGGLGPSVHGRIMSARVTIPVPNSSLQPTVIQAQVKIGQ